MNITYLFPILVHLLSKNGKVLTHLVDALCELKSVFCHLIVDSHRRLPGIHERPTGG